MARKRKTISEENFIIISEYLCIFDLELGMIYTSLKNSIPKSEMDELKLQHFVSINDLILQIVEDLDNLNLNELVKIPEDTIHMIFELFDECQKLVHSVIKQSEINNLIDESLKNNLLSISNYWNSMITRMNFLLLEDK